MKPFQLNTIHCFLFDMDGTIFLGESLIPGARELVAMLEQRGMTHYFLTNNSSRSRADYVSKLHTMGLDVPEERIFTSGEATALYLKRQKPGARIYLLGTPSLQQEFRLHGFELVEQDPDYAVMGFDTTLTYEKISKFCDFVREGRPYLATHPDVNCPIKGGYIPDIGAFIALVAASTGRQPDVIIGKPNPPIVETILQKTGVPLDEIAMVGDRLYTDIALGAAGIHTILVLSGETKAADVPASPFQPDLVFNSVQDLYRLLLTGF